MRILFFFLACLSFPAWSQPVQVISVDPALSRNAGKSLFLSMAMSAALPGTGERYLGEPMRARPFHAADGLFWSALAVTWFAGEAQMQSAREYASRYAGYRPPASSAAMDEVGNYRSSEGIAGSNANPDNEDDLAQAQLRSGSDDVVVYNAGASWDWGPSDNPETTARMDRYNTMLRNYRTYRIAFQISAGLLLLNRLVSVMDVLRLHRATANESFALEAQPILSPGYSGANLQVHF